MKTSHQDRQHRRFSKDENLTTSGVRSRLQMERRWWHPEMEDNKVGGKLLAVVSLRLAVVRCGWL